MKLERNYKKEGTMRKGSKFEYYRAVFSAGSIQITNHTESGKWAYVLFLDTSIYSDDEYDTKELAYSAATAEAIHYMRLSLHQLEAQ